MRKTKFVRVVVLACTTLVAAEATAGDERCDPTITPSTPSSQFEVTNRGTAVHTHTGLTWMRCSVGQEWDGATCVGDAALYTRSDATAALIDPKIKTWGGETGWRVPTEAELLTITETRCWAPAVNGEIFPNTPNTWYWTTSPSPVPGYIQTVHFYVGTPEAARIDELVAVRLVRGNFKNP